MAILSQLILSLTVLSIFNVASSSQKNVAPEIAKLSGQQLIDYVNSNQKLWIAGPNKLDTYPERVKRGLMGVRRSKQSANKKKVYSETRFLDVTIPDEFDSRVKWPHCQSISNIRDQSACGSCWAFGAVGAMSDRICIQSEGKLQVSLSSADLVSCCIECGYGCEGGDLLEAWQYWVENGIVTGGNYTSNSDCRPYPFPPCEHHNNKTHFKPCQKDLYHTPKCEWKCQNGYTRNYEEDKFFGASAYNIEDSVQAIQKEIITNGPVEVAFDVYDDFLHYTSGIYKHVAGVILSGHAVRMIGWGVEKSVPYWLIVNSWNSDWGENGLFRILRGADECGIESYVVAGLAKL